MGDRVAAFVSHYLARQTIGDPLPIPDQVDFHHRIEVGVENPHVEFPPLSLFDIENQARHRLYEVDPKDADVRCFRLEHLLKDLYDRPLPEPVLPLLKILVEMIDHHPGLTEESSRQPTTDEDNYGLRQPSSEARRYGRPRRNSENNHPSGSRTFNYPIRRRSLIESRTPPDDYSDDSDLRRKPRRVRRTPKREVQLSDADDEEDLGSRVNKTRSRKRAQRHSSEDDNENQRMKRTPSQEELFSSKGIRTLVATSPPNNSLVPGKTSPPPKKKNHPYWGEVEQSAILRDLLYPLQGINGMYIKWHEPSKAFLIRKDVHVSEPIRVMVARISSLGSYYRRIRDIIDPHLLPASESTDVARKWWSVDTGILSIGDASNNNNNNLSSIYRRRHKGAPIVTMMPSTGTSGIENSNPVQPTIQFPSTSPEDNVSPSRIMRSKVLVAPVYQQQEYGVCEPVESLMQTAWTQYIRDNLAEYYKVLSTVEARLLQTSLTEDLGHNFPTQTMDISTGSTLRQLAVTFGDLLERMAILAEAVDAVKELKGAPLLEVLLDIGCRGDQLGHQIIDQAIIQYLLPVWVRQLSQWVSLGIVEDPFDEFFVVAQDVNKDLEYLWRSRAWLEVNRLPPFLKREIAVACLVAGKLRTMLAVADELQPSALMNNKRSERRMSSTSPVTPTALRAKSGGRPGAGIATHTKTSSNYFVNTPDEPSEGPIAMMICQAERSLTSVYRFRWPESGYTCCDLPPNNVQLSLNDCLEAQNLEGKIKVIGRTVAELAHRRSNILVYNLFTRHGLLHILDFMRKTSLLMQSDFADALVQFTISDNTICNLNHPIVTVTPHQLTQALNSAVLNSCLRHTPEWVLSRLSFVKISTEGPAWSAVGLRWDTSSTAVALLLTSTAKGVYSRLNALAWRFRVAAAALEQRVWPQLQAFRRRYRPPTQVNSPALLTLECLDEEGYLATFLSEALHIQLTHVVQVLREQLFQHFPMYAWANFLNDLKAYERLTTTTPDTTKRLSLETLIESHERYLAALCLGCFLVEEESMPPPTPSEILTTPAHLDRRPILSRIIDLLDKCMQLADLIEIVYPKLCNFLALGGEEANEDPSLQFEEIESLVDLLRSTSQTVNELLAALSSASRESDLGNIDPLEAERNSFLKALCVSINFQAFFGEGGAQTLLKVAEHLTA